MKKILKPQSGTVNEAAAPYVTLSLEPKKSNELPVIKTSQDAYEILKPWKAYKPYKRP